MTHVHLQTIRRRHRAAGIGWRVCVGIACVVYMVAIAASGVQSPKSKVQSPRAASLQQPAAPAISYLLSPISSVATVSSVVAQTNRTLTVRLAWDASPNHSIVTNYSVSYGVASGTYTNAVNAGTNLTASVSNLNSRVRYYFAAFATSQLGFTSEPSAEIFWPKPFTNYVGVSVWHRTNLADAGRVIWQTVMTNPPGDTSFFETKIWQTNDNVTVLRINSSTLLVANTNQP